MNETMVFGPVFIEFTSDDIHHYTGFKLVVDKFEEPEDESKTLRAAGNKREEIRNKLGKIPESFPGKKWASLSQKDKNELRKKLMKMKNKFGKKNKPGSKRTPVKKGKNKRKKILEKLGEKKVKGIFKQRKNRDHYRKFHPSMCD